MALARQLKRGGAEVLAIDSNGSLVDEIKEDVDLAVRLDATDETALRSQGVAEMDIAVVAIGENFESGLMTTVLLQQMGLPRIVCRAQTKTHAEIFRRIGATEVIQPETLSGEHLAHRLANDHIENLITLAKGFTLIEMRAPKEFCGKSLQELALRNRYEINLVAIKRREVKDTAGLTTTHEEIIAVPKPTDAIQPDDLLVVVGSDQALSQLPRE